MERLTEPRRAWVCIIPSAILESLPIIPATIALGIFVFWQ